MLASCTGWGLSWGVHLPCRAGVTYPPPALSRRGVHLGWGCGGVWVGANAITLLQAFIFSLTILIRACVLAAAIISSQGCRFCLAFDTYWGTC
ncbi:MAG: hypothetical protein PHF57_12095, partial [Methanoregula sp.]|nr:hypothetical protein [Methanoregula sp.]